MKPVHIFFSFIFICSALVGVWLGNGLRHENKASWYTDPDLSGRLSKEDNESEQKNYLIVTANNLGEVHQQLKSIWLITYYQDSPAITFQSIYPRTSVNGTAIDDGLEKTFKIISSNSKSFLSRIFLDKISDQGYWWSGYLVIDHYALNDLLASSPFLASHPDEKIKDIISQKDSAIQVINNAIENLTLQMLCDQITEPEFTHFWANFKKIMPPYIFSDQDIEATLQEWDSFLSKAEDPICVLTLDVLSP